MLQTKNQNSEIFKHRRDTGHLFHFENVQNTAQKKMLIC